MLTLHVVSHTHWDREWYLTFQQFRLKLVELVDGLLNILDSDPQYKHFMLDGQTIVLDDYLLMRPEKEPLIRDYIRQGRIIIGPWHILPDMFLVGPEAHIRNLLEGRRTTQKFGPRMQVGYMPDSFGHIGQMPQILRGFGIDSACLWRGLNDEPAELWWQSPDGSRVLLAYLRDSYSNGAFLPGGEAFPTESLPRFARAIQERADSLAEHSAARDVLIMLGTDHMRPSRMTSANIAYANDNLKDTRVLHSTIEAYLAAIRPIADEKELPVVKGELRNSQHIHLLPGVLSTRMWIKQRNQASETLLTRWVEPFSTFAALENAGASLTSTRLQPPGGIIRQAWRLLMENHPHDSICGCSIDQVHDEMKVRFDQVDQIGEELTRQSLEALAAHLPAQNDQPREGIIGAVTVFNAGPFSRDDLASVEIQLPPGTNNFALVDENGHELAHETLGMGAKELINARLSPVEFRTSFDMLNDGRVTGLGVRAYSLLRAGDTVHIDVTLAEGEPDLRVWERGAQETLAALADATIRAYQVRAHTPELVRLIFVAPQVPAMGWRSLNVLAKNVQSQPISLPPLARALLPLAGRLARLPLAESLIGRLQSEPRGKSPALIENEFFKVELEPAGTLSVLDKRDGTSYRGLNRFVDSGDCGDEYNYSPPFVDGQMLARLKRVTTHPGTVRQVMVVELSLKTPLALAPNRKSRAKDLVEIPITCTVSLTAGVPRVEFHTRLENRARDHRLRVHFPTPFKTESAAYDGHFEIVERRIGVPNFDRQKWIEDPRPETHQRAFSEVSDDRQGLILANRGLPEVEVLKTPSGNEIALTLLRCVGWLSRDDFQTRRGHAGPAIETPGAQMQGVWEFDYALIPFDAAGRQNARGQAYAFETPFRALAVSGGVPGSGEYLAVTATDASGSGSGAFILSAVKTTGDGAGWLVRGFNSSPETLNLVIKPRWPFEHAARVDLSEEQVAGLEIDPETGAVRLEVKGHEILTVWFDNPPAAL